MPVPSYGKASDSCQEKLRRFHHSQSHASAHSLWPPIGPCVRNSTKIERELVLEMRIRTKRGKDVELSRERESDGKKRYIILYEENIQQWLGGLRLALNQIGS